MSAKKKYEDIKVSAESLKPNTKEGWLTKQGGSIKSWKRRYCILKDSKLYYFKGPKEPVFQGRVDLESNSLVKEEPPNKEKKKNLISVTTSKRVFFMYPDTKEEVQSWVDAISQGIERAKSVSGTPSTSPQDPISTPTNNPTTISPAASDKNPTEIRKEMSNAPPRKRLALAKASVQFLKDEDSKVLEFWQIWSESIPVKEDIATGMAIEFTVAVSADMQKLTWRTGGPQNIFIQKMVDFFWNVGAPEAEIDRLNDVGADINPVKIGSWIDMSAKGGMDGGWFFPVDITLKSAVASADPGDAISKFASWATEFGITNVYAVGRDMGAAPPRQTEIRFKLPSPDFNEQVRVALDAFQAFGFPPLPNDAVTILKETKVAGLALSVITSSEGFVRLGLLIPKPKLEATLVMCEIANGHAQDIAAFEGSLGCEGPAWAEYQYLMKGFGYGVYKEGFDIVFHYNVGEETSD